MSQALQGTGRAGHWRGQEHRPRIALTLARDGATVLVNGRSTRRRSMSSSARSRRPAARPWPRWATSPILQIAPSSPTSRPRRSGGVDILVSNAGLRRQTSFLDMSFEEWREILSVALDGAFLLGKAFVPQMVAKGQGGAFVAMSGVSTHVGTPNRCHVSASKSGLEGLMRALAVELAPHRHHLQRPVARRHRHGARALRRAGAAQPHQPADPAQALRHGRRDRRHGPPAGRAGRHLHHRPDHPCERR